MPSAHVGMVSSGQRVPHSIRAPFRDEAAYRGCTRAIDFVKEGSESALLRGRFVNSFVDTQTGLWYQQLGPTY